MIADVAHYYIAALRALAHFEALNDTFARLALMEAEHLLRSRMRSDELVRINLAMSCILQDGIATGGRIGLGPEGGHFP